MEKELGNFAKIWKVLKPWCLIVGVLIVLRYTGVLSGISYVAGSALMHTGIMDAGTHEPAITRKFNYNFKIRDLEGKVSDVSAFKNKIVFLNIWATWCGPCRMEMPSIQSLYNQVDTAKVMFVMLSVDQPKDIDKVKSYVSDKEFTFPVFVPASTLPSQLQVNTIPSTFIISPDGKVVSSQTGATNYDTPEFKKFLESFMKP